jgi:ubiquinone/menaquinone biosynthesis C-methylase UbiE
MEAKAVNPEEFRDGQRSQWNQAASGWKKWSEMFDRAAGGVSERLVELAGVAPGSRVIDIGAGYGEPTLSAAKVAGPDGVVVSTDPSPEMLAFGRERAADAGVENIEFVEANAFGLNFPDETFDAALSRWGIIFDPDGEGAAAVVRGMMKPGGRMAISSWGPPDRTPFLGIPVKTAMQALDVPPPPPGTPGPLSRPTGEALGALLEGGGFSDVKAEEMAVTLEWDSPEEFTIYVKEIAPPVRAMIEPHPADVQEQTWNAITEAVREAAGDGKVSLTNQVWLASGQA